MKISFDIKGFPEWSPILKKEENRWIDTIRSNFELACFQPFESASVENIKSLLAKGDITKEIFSVSRYQSDEESEVKYALHYDLTVPFARYISKRMGQILFPFKRYQIQKSWRGERPQAGRFREFYQCDVDVLDKKPLTALAEFDVLSTVNNCIKDLVNTPVTIYLNNRKIISGYLEILKIEDTVPILRVIDKLDKIGDEEVAVTLSEHGLNEHQISSIMSFIKMNLSEMNDFVDNLNLLNCSLLQDGLCELDKLVSLAVNNNITNIKCDFSMVRGFDYYTGNIVEVKFDSYPNFGTICSGGSYDSLVNDLGAKGNIFGFGMSIGLTRIFSKMVTEDLLSLKELQAFGDGLIINIKEHTDSERLSLLCALRRKGHRVDLFPRSEKLGKQIKFAVSKGYKYVFFTTTNDNQMEVKDLNTGIQKIMNVNNFII